MNTSLSFDDVLILPQFSDIESRKDVNTESIVCGTKLSTPIISSNMACITNSRMAMAMTEVGAIGCLHRFWDIETNVKEFLLHQNAWVSVGLGAKELERTIALKDSGAEDFVLDVAHGATVSVAKQAKAIRELIGKNKKLIVGNFATKETIKEFARQTANAADAYKVGIGNGGACTTRVVTGVGLPLFTSITDCVNSGYDIIADGGCRNSGDICKSIAAGAKAVMSGRLFIDTMESAAELVDEDGVKISTYREQGGYVPTDRYKQYSGSASQESYEAQGKVAEHRTAEGESYLVKITGQSVVDVVQEINAGLRSSMSYVGARNIDEYKKKSKFVQISSSSAAESAAHGRPT